MLSNWGAGCICFALWNTFSGNVMDLINDAHKWFERKHGNSLRNLGIPVGTVSFGVLRSEKNSPWGQG